MNDFSTGFTLQLFHLSDQEANTSSVELAPNLSAVYNALSAEDIDGDGEAGYANTVFLSSGDAWIPGLFYEASGEIYGADGAADVLIQNELGIQAIAFGNHEFDNGTGIIATLLTGEVEVEDGETFEPFGGANYPYLSGNLDFTADENLGPLVTDDGQDASTIPGQIAASTVVVTESGERIGVVGATTPTVGGISSPGNDIVISPDDFSNSSDEDIAALAAEIQADVDALLEANPDIDKVILLSHMQVISIEFQLAELLEGVDIIMAGGSNSVLLDENDVPFADDTAFAQYPSFFTGADGNPVAVVNTDAAYQYLGRLVIDFDDNGVIIPESYDPDLSGAFATDDAGVERVGAEGLADPEIVAITAAVEEEIVSGESVFFAVTDVFLNGERAGGPIDGVRTQETNLGNLTADANLEYARQFDETVVVSYKNGGGIRANIGSIVVPGGDEDPQRLPPEGVPGAKPEGGISQNDVQNTLAFNNGLTLLSLDTAQLVNVLESTVSSWESIDAGSGGFGQYSGVQFSFDPSLEPGSRIVNAGVFAEDGTLIAQLVVDGELVDNGDQTFRTVTLDFLADGGGPGLPVTNPEEDGFDADIAAATNRVDLVDSENPTFTGPATFSPDGGEQDALAEYLLENFGNEEGDPTFSIADTPVEEDERIQNLSFREDTVFGASDGGGGDGVSEIRVATFNASLERSAEGELISDLSTGDNAQAQNVAQIIQQTNADIILINEFDFDENGEAAALFQQNYLSVSQGGEDPVEYPFVYVAPTNTGVDSGLDLNGDGETGTPNDAFGFGTYPGEFGFIILSKYEIDEPNIRTFQEFLWQDMPDSLLLADTDDSEPLTELLDDDAIAGFRLSSKNHVDLPVIVDGETVHVLAAHPTPPVFDDPTFDLNGKRNADEIRFWADYVAGEDYITDDAGVSGGLAEGSRFVIVGDYNSDPFDGDSRDGAAQQLLENELILASTTDASITPSGPGGVDNGEGGVNADHEGNPAFDTADFGFNADDPANDVDPGNLRVDLALPSVAGFDYIGGEVVWPANDDPLAQVTNFPTSDHRLVSVDLRLVDDTGSVTLGAGEEVAAREVTVDGALGDESFAPIDGGFTFGDVAGGTGTTIYGAETIAFSDETLNASETENSGNLARVYETAFDRLYDIPGMSFWEGVLEAGAITLEQAGSLFADSIEFAAANGTDLNNEGYVDALIANAGIGDSFGDERDSLVNALNAGETTRGEVLISVANSDDTVALTENLTDDGVLTLAA